MNTSNQRSGLNTGERYLSPLLKLTPGTWRPNGPQVTAFQAYNSPVAIVVSRADQRPTVDAAAHDIPTAGANAQAIAEVPRLVQALAMLLAEVRDPGTYPEGAAANAAARALRRAIGCDQTRANTREIADVMQAYFNEDGTP